MSVLSCDQRVPCARCPWRRDADPLYWDLSQYLRVFLGDETIGAAMACHKSPSDLGDVPEELRSPLSGSAPRPALCAGYALAMADGKGMRRWLATTRRKVDAAFNAAGLELYTSREELLSVVIRANLIARRDGIYRDRYRRPRALLKLLGPLLAILPGKEIARIVGCSRETVSEYREALAITPRVRAPKPLYSTADLIALVARRKRPMAVDEILKDLRAKLCAAGTPAPRGVAWVRTVRVRLGNAFLRGKLARPARGTYAPLGWTPEADREARTPKAKANSRMDASMDATP